MKKETHLILHCGKSISPVNLTGRAHGAMEGQDGILSVPL